VGDELLGRSLCSATSFSSIPRVFVFTRPIEMSMFLIHSSLRARSTDVAVHTDVGELPPGRTITVAMVNVSGYPHRLDGDVHARSSVRAMTCSFQSGAPRVDVSVAPKSAAGRDERCQIDGDDLGRPVEPGRHDGGDPTGPERSRRRRTGAHLSVLQRRSRSRSGRMSESKDALGIGHAVGDL